MWNGCTPADVVFPAFLFIMGTALGLALCSYAGNEWTRPQIYRRILRRSAILFGLGVLLNLATAMDLSNLRIMGVLQRIALCYLFTAVILLHLSPRAQWGTTLLLLLGYWAALSWIPVPAGTGAGANLPAYFDRIFLGRAHLLQSSPYDSEMDPEGLLTTAPALANVLFGAFMGRWLSRQPIASAISARLCAAGLTALVLGLAWSHWLPLNKALWTSSYALVTAGATLIGYSLCHELVDARSVYRWSRPFELIGVNAMVAYLVSTAMNVLLIRAMHGAAYEWIAAHAPDWTEGPNAALVCAFAQALAIWALVAMLHRRRWYVRI